MRLRPEGYDFVHVTFIVPERDPRGRLLEFMPQARYRNRLSFPLNPNGSGPFCKFRVRAAPGLAGVYAVTVDGRVTYLGECEDLAERWGSRGYGSIQPRNCFVGGQSTNCKVNHLILRAAQAGASVELWFHGTLDRKAIEAELRRRLKPPWNALL